MCCVASYNYRHIFERQCVGWLPPTNKVGYRQDIDSKMQCRLFILSSLVADVLYAKHYHK